MPDEPKYRLLVTPFWLDLLFVSVASRLFLEANQAVVSHSIRILQSEPVIWLTQQLILYAGHLLGGYVLIPTFIRRDHPKAALLWSSVIAWLLLPGMAMNVCC